MKSYMDTYFCDMEKLYQEMESLARKDGLTQTLAALPYAREKHSGQFRAGKEKFPYYCHPLMTAFHAVCLGIREDEVLAAALLHDVCEDCGAAPEELPAGDKVKEAVKTLTREGYPARISKESKDRYYKAVSGNRIALLVKLLDRCNNISTMAGAFSKEKMVRYGIDTIERVYPLFALAEKEYPEYIPALKLIRYHMDSVLGAVLGEM